MMTEGRMTGAGATASTSGTCSISRKEAMVSEQMPRSHSMMLRSALLMVLQLLLLLS